MKEANCCARLIL